MRIHQNITQQWGRDCHYPFNAESIVINTFTITRMRHVRWNLIPRYCQRIFVGWVVFRLFYLDLCWFLFIYCVFIVYNFYDPNLTIAEHLTSQRHRTILFDLVNNLKNLLLFIYVFYEDWSINDLLLKFWNDKNQW